MTAKTLSRTPASRTTGLAAEYLRVRQASIDLIADLDPEDCVVQTMPEVSPAKWHLAHVTWFFEQFVLLAGDRDRQPFNEQFLYLFNSYYQTVGEMHARPQRGLLNRPLLREVLAYRRFVDDAMLELIETRIDDDELAFLVTLGLQHEHQHQELLLTDIKHVFFTNPLHPVYRERRPVPVTTSDEPGAVRYTAGRYEIGHAGSDFSFDNETPRHEILLGDFELGSRLITNGEYADFIGSGAYDDAGLWLSDGWAHLKKTGWQRPLYWSEDGEREFTLSGWQELDSGAPVCHISYYEADAFARWANARLPSEGEWEVAAEPVRIEGNTLDSGLLHPSATGSRQADTPQQLWGDVWEWTASPYAPYPRFRPLAGSLGEYNGKFMANQMVVRGGSCVTWADHLRATYRSFFYPHDRWQFLGFRLARDL